MKQESIHKIQQQVKEILIQILQLEGKEAEEINFKTPFFQTDDHPGLIQDSLAILELATLISEEFDIMPSDLDQESFVDIETLSSKIERLRLSELA